MVVIEQLQTHSDNRPKTLFGFCITKAHGCKSGVGGSRVQKAIVKMLTIRSIYRYFVTVVGEKTCTPSVSYSNSYESYRDLCHLMDLQKGRKSHKLYRILGAPLAQSPTLCPLDHPDFKSSFFLDLELKHNFFSDTEVKALPHSIK